MKRTMLLLCCCAGLSFTKADIVFETVNELGRVDSIQSIESVLYINYAPIGGRPEFHIIENGGPMVLLKPAIAGTEGPMDWARAGNLTFFEYNDVSEGQPGQWNMLWVTDLTPEGTQKLTGGVVSSIYPVGNNVFFRRYIHGVGWELWVYPIGGQAREVKDLYPGAESSYPGCMFSMNDKLYFFAKVYNHGWELCVSDGTEQGTHMVKDMNPGLGNGVPYDVVNWGVWVYYCLRHEYKPTFYNGSYYFLANDGVHGYELWRTDGTEAGTRMVKDINPNGDAFDDNENPFHYHPDMCVLNDHLYFVAHDGVHGKELWVTDGTESGTRLVKDINPGPDYSYIGNMVAYNGAIYFSAQSSTDNIELWRTRGTDVSTEMVIDLLDEPLLPNQGSRPRELRVHEDGYLYFVCLQVEDLVWCEPGSCNENLVLSDNLFRTDGTAAGTELVLNLGTPNRRHSLTSTSHGLYFKMPHYLIGLDQLVRMRYDDAPEFVSDPLLSVDLGQQYTYNIQVTDPNGDPITIEATQSADWLTLTDNGDGTAQLSGIPDEAGDFPIVLTARTANSSVTQSFTIHVSEQQMYSVRVYMYDEAMDNPSASNPRIYLRNDGQVDLSDFKVEYYFRCEIGKSPIAEIYYAPGSTVNLVNLGYGYYKIVYDYTGATLRAGQVLPDNSGSVVGIHYTDWSPYNATNDYSNNLSRTFAENNRICVFAANNSLISGIPPSTNLEPVANAGADVIVTDAENDGETVVLNGSGSYDPDGTIVSYEWYRNGALLATGVTAPVLFQQGMHTVELRVTDNEGGVANDFVIIMVNGPGSNLTFTINTAPVPANNPVTLSYQVPASMDGVVIRALLQREWDRIPWGLSGAAGDHTMEIWDWNKYFFGGSGPWTIQFEVNGIIIETKQISFAY